MEELLQPVLDRLTPVGRQNFRPLALTVNLGYRFYAHNLHRFYTCDWPLQMARRTDPETNHNSCHRESPGMRLTLIQPAIGHRIGESYIRSW